MGGGGWGHSVLKTSDLDYHLPPELIATRAAEPRDSARLLVVSRSDPARLDHLHVRDLPGLLRPGDAIIVNTSRVIPARFAGVRRDTGGRVDGLYIGPGAVCGPAADGAIDAAGGAPWRVMLKARRLREGVRVDVHDLSGAGDGGAAGVSLRLIERSDEPGEEGAWIVQADGPGVRPGDTAVSVLERIGAAPLPPYIRSARKRAAGQDEASDDRTRYQTVYARADQEGSVAAPTAGLHFTPALLEALHASGVERADVVLHVGVGTFKPVEAEYVEAHPMHAEWCEVSAATIDLIGRSRARGGRIFAVGTTAARTLESLTDEELGAGRDVAKWTRILITPGYRFRVVDGLMTNFHLPRSTLMAMVGALLNASSGDEEGEGRASDGVARLKAIYAEAVRAAYRFYSFGDAMLVLP